MYIKKITISNFGKLSDFEISPSKGLNIIYAPNESGKTTLLSFIKYVFYGPKFKKNSGDLTFKERYMPWNGLPMSGSCVISKVGDDYIIQRSDSERSSKLSVNNANTGDDMKDITNPGMYFMSVGERAFSDSCFVTDIFSINASTTDGELVSLLSDSCDDKNTYTNIRHILNERLLQTVSLKRKSSDLSIIEKSLSDHNEELYRINGKITDLKQKITYIDECEKKINEIKEKNDKLYLTKEKIIYDKLSSETDDLYIEKRKLEKELEYLNQSDTQNGVDNISEDEKKLLLTDFSEYNNAAYIMKHNSFLLLLIIILCMGLSVLSFFASLYNMLFFAVTPVLGAITCFSVFKYIKLFRKRKTMLKEFLSLKSQKETVMSKYNLSDYADCIEFVSTQSGKVSRELYHEKKEFIQIRLEHINNTICDYENKLEKARHMYSFETIETNSFTNQDIDDIINSNEQKLFEMCETVNRGLHYKDEYLNLKNDLMKTEKEIEQLNIQKSQIQQSADVLETAINILDTAFAKAKNTVFPEISKRTYEIFCQITDNEYNSIVTDEKFDIKYFEDGFMRDARFLSKGTLDILYFSLRIAIIDIMSVDGDAIPVFLDDVLANCDDKRVTSILDMIYKLSQNHQIFLCTCRGREGEFFKDYSDVNIIRMQKG